MTCWSLFTAFAYNRIQTLYKWLEYFPSRMMGKPNVVLQNTNLVLEEPEGLSLHSQQPVSDLYPEPVESSPHPYPISLRSILIPSLLLHLGLLSGLLPTKILYTYLLSHTCHMPCPCPCSYPPHFAWLYLPNDIWRWVLMKSRTK
jgi:hypothetical protein